MARVTAVKKAMKDYPEQQIKKGEPYYWWKFRYGPKRFSKTYPKPQQLTQSEFTGQLYDLQDQVAALDKCAKEDLETTVSDIAQAIRDLACEQEDKKNNMPDSLQESATGELLQGRYDSCEQWADDLEAVDLSGELADVIDELQGCEYQED
jgi:hypothetical protein